MAESVAPVVGLLSDMGVPDDEIIPVIRAFRSMLHGFVTLEAGRGFGLPVDIDASFDLAVEMGLAAVQGRAG